MCRALIPFFGVGRFQNTRHLQLLDEHGFCLNKRYAYFIAAYAVLLSERLPLSGVFFFEEAMSLLMRAPLKIYQKSVMEQFTHSGARYTNDDELRRSNDSDFDFVNDKAHPDEPALHGQGHQWEGGNRGLPDQQAQEPGRGRLDGCGA